MAEMDSLTDYDCSIEIFQKGKKIQKFAETRTANQVVLNVDIQSNGDPHLTFSLNLEDC